MKGFLKALIALFAVAIISLIVFIVFTFVLPLEGFRNQMIAGRKYMDSMTEKDFHIWEERTQKYLSQENITNHYQIDAIPVPPELKQLKILRIDRNTNLVIYVWLGGLDHTYLRVEKVATGQFEFTAAYNDESNRVIWPKASNAVTN